MINRPTPNTRSTTMRGANAAPAGASITPTAQSNEPSVIETVVAENIEEPIPNPSDAIGAGVVQLESKTDESDDGTLKTGEIQYVGSFIVKREGSSLHVYPNDGTAPERVERKPSVDVVLDDPSSGKTIMVMIANITKVEPTEAAVEEVQQTADDMDASAARVDADADEGGET